MRWHPAGKHASDTRRSLWDEAAYAVTPKAIPTAPRLFISYSHDSCDHEDRVRALADQLRKDGVDAVLDQYDTAPPDGWPMWADREIAKAHFVVLICTDTYLKRVEGREEPNKGRGVLWEGRLIYNHLYDTDTAVQRLVPVLMGGAAPHCIPWPIRGLTHYRVDTPEGYEDLYRHVTGQARHITPELGKLKTLPGIAPQSYPASLELGAGPPHPSTLDRRNRTQMLKRVRLDWIDGVLNRSLYRIAPISLELQSKADAVENPLSAVVQIEDESRLAASSGATLTSIFDAHGGSLLILGAPGTGKTTLLLELARELLRRAEEDPNYPIPVVFNLSTWAARRRPLAQWLVTELNERSDVPMRVARQWVATEQILPLLDGLDEVAVDHRSACIEAINTFRRGHGLLPIAVCSRISDYEILGARLRLRTAVAVQPLTTSRIKDYVKSAGEPLQPLQAALEEDPSVLELLDTPLMLWVGMLAYRDAPVVFAQQDSMQQRRRLLLASFVDTMFKRRAADSSYTRAQAVHWLSELACALTRNNESVFRLENLRPEWMATRTQRSLARAATVLASGLAGGPALGLMHGLITWLLITLLARSHANLTRMASLFVLTARFGWEWARTSWWGVALCFGLLGVFLEVKPTETIRISLDRLSSRSGRALRTGLLMGLAVWLGLFPMVLSNSERAYDALRQKGMVQLWLALGVPSVLFSNNATKLLILFVIGFGLLVVPVAGVIVGLISLLSGEAVQARTRPNQGTILSAKTALTSLLLLGFGGGVIGALGSSTDPSGVVLGVLYGLSCALIVGMIAGGMFSLKHYAVRLALRMNGLAPFNYVRFLDYAAERFFLYKVGGGYMFVHRAIMDYFVSLKR